ncbi:heterokaryon incompatibility protein-domain-containing protein, partial [Dendryphion nanum]
NLQSHLDSIPWEQIPSTFRWAIEFTRSMGIKYIWIDSLCIVQDDELDWACESAKMCDVYSWSYLTIATTSSPNCLSDLSKIGQGVVTVEVSGTSEVTQAPYRVFVSKFIKDHPDVESGSSQPEWPLLGRGWVLQERLLSSRVLHLSEPELIWECREETSCECGRIQSLGKPEHHQGIRSGSTMDLITQWQFVAEQYSTLKLSMASDLLPALSGLATQMARKKPKDAQYIAGLWSDSFVQDLTWRSSYMNCTPVLKQRVPSWSW